MAVATEIISGPLDVYVAETTNAVMPTLGATPDPAVWYQLSQGTTPGLGQTTLNMSEEGLTIRHPQEFFEVRVAGSTMPRRVFRTSEGLVIAFTLFDVRMEAYRKVLNNNDILTTGVTNQEYIDLYRGRDVRLFSLLVRGRASPKHISGAEHGWAQYEVPQVYQAGNPEPVYTKSEATGLAFEFMALYDSGATGGRPLGTYRYQTG